MSILCPICGEPPLCTCQIARMNERLVASESENKRLRGALEKIAKDRVRVEYRHIDDAVFDLTSAARIAISALEGEKSEA